MTRLFLAIRVFFRVLFDGVAADQISGLLAGPAPAPPKEAPSAAPAQPSAPPQRASKPVPTRSEAITLLAALQREARLVDFLQEPLNNYSDAQIGAAVREVHRNSAAVIERMFALEPVEASAEGAEIAIPDGDTSTRFHLVGNVGATGARRGKLCHKGWQATRCQLPEWTGADQAKLIVAPAEVELS